MPSLGFWPPPPKPVKLVKLKVGAPKANSGCQTRPWRPNSETSAGPSSWLEVGLRVRMMPKRNSLRSAGVKMCVSEIVMLVVRRSCSRRGTVGRLVSWTFAPARFHEKRKNIELESLTL
jgi:hypothetical protein